VTDGDPNDDLTPDLRRRLRILADTLPILEAPDFTPGRWHDSEKREDNVWTMPWYELSPQAEAVTRAVGQAGLLQPGFDWPTWAQTAEAQALRHDPDALAAATPDQLGKLLTALIREDRFNEGALGDTFESGFMTAVVRRAKALAG
jgi:Family of unknown function (DUF6508)